LCVVSFLPRVSFWARGRLPHTFSQPDKARTSGLSCAGIPGCLAMMRVAESRPLAIVNRAASVDRSNCLVRELPLWVHLVNDQATRPGERDRGQYPSAGFSRNHPSRSRKPWIPSPAADTSGLASLRPQLDRYSKPGYFFQPLPAIGNYASLRAFLNVTRNYRGKAVEILHR
jgi:hypothetical protein